MDNMIIANTGKTLTINRPDPVELTPEQEKQRLLQEHVININWLSIGCVVTIGCKKIPFASSADALAAITEYVKDPSQATKKWLKKLS